MEYGVSVIVNSTPVVTNRSEEHLWHTMSFAGGLGGVTTTSGARVTPKSAMGYPPLWRAINLISSSVAGLPLDVFRRRPNGAKKVDLRHPAQGLLNRKASPFTSSYMFRRTMTGLALLHGNSFASIDRDTSSRPMSLTIWDPQNTLIRIVDGNLWYITYVRHQPVKVMAKDMLHIRGLGPDGIGGYPVLSLMAEALGVGMAAQEFGARFFGQGSNMAGLLMIPGTFSEEKIRNTIQAWNSMQSGLTQSHKVALLQDGVKFQQMTIDPDKAQFTETREHEVRATVSNITGVPPHMLGDATRTSHNSLESEGQSYLDYTLQPWLQTWETECEEKLLTDQQQETESHFIEFNREALVQMSFRDKVEGIYRQTEMGLLDLNEGRRLLNYPELPEDKNRRFHPANWVVIGAEQEGLEGMSDDQQESDDPKPKSAPALQKLVTSSVTKAYELETSKAIRLASSRAHEFINAVEEFYVTWTENTLPGLDDASVRAMIDDHARQSKAALFDTAGTSTTDSLKANVAELVVTWDARRDALIQSILKAVEN